ncbi:hypothetical protein [Streptomyces achromogenes]|uniref:hypothetical protein n=1 Tax=Streptomyces achromogenes TaxID=67255 RepID=UPI0037202A6D
MTAKPSSPTGTRTSPTTPPARELQAKPFEKGGGLFPEAMSDDWAAKGGPGLSHFLDGNLEAHAADLGIPIR